MTFLGVQASVVKVTDIQIFVIQFINHDICY